MSGHHEAPSPPGPTSQGPARLGRRQKRRGRPWRSADRPGRVECRASPFGGHRRCRARQGARNHCRRGRRSLPWLRIAGSESDQNHGRADRRSLSTMDLARARPGLSPGRDMARRPPGSRGPRSTASSRSASSTRYWVPTLVERSLPSRIQRRTVSGLRPTRRAASGTVSIAFWDVDRAAPMASKDRDNVGHWATPERALPFHRDLERPAVVLRGGGRRFFFHVVAYYTTTQRRQAVRRPSVQTVCRAWLMWLPCHQAGEDPPLPRLFRTHENARRNHSSAAPSPPMQAPASSKSRSVGPSGQDLLYAAGLPTRYVVINEIPSSLTNLVKLSTKRQQLNQRARLRPT